MHVVIQEVFDGFEQVLRFADVVNECVDGVHGAYPCVWRGPVSEAAWLVLANMRPSCITAFLLRCVVVVSESKRARHVMAQAWPVIPRGVDEFVESPKSCALPGQLVAFHVVPPVLFCCFASGWLGLSQGFSPWFLPGVFPRAVD